MRRVILGSLVLAAVAAAVWFLADGQGTAPPPDPVDGPPGGARDDPADAGARRVRPREGSLAAGTSQKPDSPADVAADLRAALSAGDEERARAAATALRQRLRTDPAAWDLAVQKLLDPREDATVRAALALVIGTLATPRTDAVLIAALGTASAEGTPEDLRRAIVLALGATREPPEKDDVFAFGDRPWGEDGPCGLGITVRRRIEDPASRAALAGLLREAPEEIRRVAAVSLRHSLEDPDAREAFVASLRDEKADDPLAVVGESLAAVARRSGSVEERERLFRLIFARAQEEDLDGLRFRVTDDLDRVRLPDDVTDSLHALAVSDRSFALRSFALDVLTACATSRDADGATEVRRTRDLLVRTVESATDPALRDLAARHLRRLPSDPAAAAALLHALRTDAEWNVRYTALETLAKQGGTEGAAAIEAGKRDGDERVKALAAELSEAK